MVQSMRLPPHAGRLRNALNHMWGYVSDAAERMPEQEHALLELICQQAAVQQKRYLLESTALSELGIWLDSP